MPPYLSPLFKLRLSALGEDLNSWGDPNLNNALKLIEEAVAGTLSLTITGDRTLTSDNYISNEYRRGIHILTGSPAADFVITVPPISYAYRFINRTGKQATIKTASGVAAVVRVGRTTTVLCDGTDCTALDATLDQIKTAAANVGLGGFNLTGVGNATADDHAVNRGQVTSLTAASIQLASDWAQKAAGTVNGTEYSAKLWATSTTALTGGNKGAKGYAQDAASSSSAASGFATSSADSAIAAAGSATSAASSLADFVNRYVVGSDFPTTGNFDGRIAYSATSQQFGVYKTSRGAYSPITIPSQATDTAAGIVELATSAEATAGTDTIRAVTPAGVAAVIAAGVAFFKRTNFTAGGTFTKDSRTKQIFVECIGGGGSGSASGMPSVTASGGCGGSYTSLWLNADSVGATEIVLVGAGGNGISTGAGNSVFGNAGGPSSFGSWLKALGGSGGSNSTSSFPTLTTAGGGSRFTSSFMYVGTDYGMGNFSFSGDTLRGGAGGGGYPSTAGGTSMLHGNGGAGNQNGAAGGAGVAPGGAGGGVGNPSASSGSSGAGARGEVRVWEFG